ncbi:USP6 N-terminal-like protein isoform X2 [Canis lupus dingo]|uniref:USP6 N-terminal-like protein isoform X2 n=1 Tax=Canis lupus dingo TaxID=286419 RepID=UPI000DC74FCB|nr:USP6 N-terminal-like protein isoform X2 [Canis lupus dingo]
MKEAALVSSWDIMQINLDVNRTFRSHTMFWDRYGVRQRALFHVLAAYSVYDTVSVPAPASCPAGGLVLSAGDQRDSRLGPQLHGPEMPGRVSLLQDEQGAGCRPPRGGRACVPQGPRVHRGRPRTRIWTLTDGTTDENPGGEGSHSPEGHQAEVPRRLLPSMAHSRRAPRGPQLTHSKEVGYCQGMSKITAILLTFLPEEDAFWALAQLMTIDRHAMHGFFIPGFQKLLRFQAHHERVLERAVPDLKKHMDEEQMSTGIYTPKWFPQCFLSQTPFSLTQKLRDVYILDGERVLTAMAYTILKVHRKCLLKLPLEGLWEFVRDSLAQPWALEDEAVLRHLRASITQFRRMRCDLPPPPGMTLSGPGHPSCPAATAARAPRWAVTGTTRAEPGRR